MSYTPKFLLTNTIKGKGTNKYPKLKEGSQTAIKSQLFFSSNFAIFKKKNISSKMGSRANQIFWK